MVIYMYHIQSILTLASISCTPIYMYMYGDKHKGTETQLCALISVSFARPISNFVHTCALLVCIFTFTSDSLVL